MPVATGPHLPYNPGDNVPCVGVIAHTDPHEQESVVLLDLGDPGVAPRSPPSQNEQPGRWTGA